MKHEILLQEVFEFVDQKITEKIRIPQLSEKINYSVYHFCRVFSKWTGMSPVRYITLRKLQYAAYDLSLGNKVIDVALKYGFDTPEGFTKGFKSHFSNSPTKYPFLDKVDYPQNMDIKYFNKTFGGNVMTSQPIHAMFVTKNSFTT